MSGAHINSLAHVHSSVDARSERVTVEVAADGDLLVNTLVLTANRRGELATAHALRRGVGASTAALEIGSLTDRPVEGCELVRNHCRPSDIDVVTRPVATHLEGETVGNLLTEW
jgi:hypothetical protein